MIARAVRWLSTQPGPKPRRFRAEGFGGIVQLDRPTALVFIDRARARALGHEGGTSWSGEAEFPGRLSAPLEAHLQLTNRCGAGCSGCYTAATPAGLPHEQDLAGWRASIDALAAMGVFHVALGGGESALLPWLGEVASYAREKGLVPNLTTSGLYDEATLARLVGIADRFGQINVSVDGVGASYEAVRGLDGFERADRAVVALRGVNAEVGLNAVLTRRSFPELGALFRYARSRRLSQIELLRYQAVRARPARLRRAAPPRRASGAAPADRAAPVAAPPHARAARLLARALHRAPPALAEAAQVVVDLRLRGGRSPGRRQGRWPAHRLQLRAARGAR